MMNKYIKNIYLNFKEVCETIKQYILNKNYNKI